MEVLSDPRLELRGRYEVEEVLSALSTETQDPFTICY